MVEGVNRVAAVLEICKQLLIQCLAENVHPAAGKGRWESGGMGRREEKRKAERVVFLCCHEVPIN